ncbi:ECF-type sigma factor [Melghirimyces algeriensis]|uniref:Sigma-70, region 4 n=1 Tax=Melghirimyces algeriensis TaxID=910412 RepID=A0A521F724_9BACL|nr:ECF-type sigma factor [Melghirimyces algeriensis]SMO91973.1 Sigma-70, region 4 [Melghirimyces algeriensis]
MGAPRHDKEAAHRRYGNKYTLSSAEGVAKILRDLHNLRERRFHAGDYAACDILLDLDNALEKANLTNRQKRVVFYVYEQGYSHVEAAELMGVGKAAVTNLLNGTPHYDGALERIAEIYRRWGCEKTNGVITNE